MRHTTFLILLALALLSLAACNALSPEQQSAIGTVLDDMHRSGRLTTEQYYALLEALQTGSMDRIMNVAIEVGAAVVLSLLGVRAWRGPITARRGVPPGVEIVPPSAPPPMGVANG